MDVVIADRIQFAFTIMFHYLFPITTMGLVPFVALYTIKSVRGDADASKAAAFWTRIFAVNFAIGVVTGIPMEFQFGTNWAEFSQRSGAVIGAPLEMEGMYAFFIESIFLGVLFFGRNRVAPALYAASGVIVWLGSWLSGFFICVTDAWMQHPIAYRIAENGRIDMTNLAAVLFQPFALYQWMHAITGALITGGFIVAGVGAYYALAGREPVMAKRFMHSGVIVALIFSILAVFPTGDRNAAVVTAYQPVKLAAMEGLFESENGAPLAIIGMPDTKTDSLLDPIEVPDVLSFLAYGNFNANVKGLHAYSTELWPPVELTYYAYHIMIGLSSIFGLVAVIAAFLLWRKRLEKTPIVLWALLLMIPFPYIANEAGWVTAEVGRQPWIIYGLMKTSAGTSPTVMSGETIFTLLGFAGMYFLLGVLFLYLTLREIGLGPSHVQPHGHGAAIEAAQ